MYYWSWDLSCIRTGSTVRIQAYCTYTAMIAAYLLYRNFIPMVILRRERENDKCAPMRNMIRDQSRAPQIQYWIARFYWSCMYVQASTDSVPMTSSISDRLWMPKLKPNAALPTPSTASTAYSDYDYLPKAQYSTVLVLQHHNNIIYIWNTLRLPVDILPVR